MDRGARLFSFLEKASQLLHAPRSQSDARELLCELAEENLEFFRSFPEYVQHVASLQIANNFAHLPNEVISDVVTIAAKAQNFQHVQVELQFLKEIQGSWGQLAQQQSLVLLKKRRLYSISYRLGAVKKDKIAFREMGNRRIGYAKFAHANEFNLLRRIGAKIHESIEFSNVGNTSSEVLDLITGHFTQIAWRCTENGPENCLQRGPSTFSSGICNQST